MWISELERSRITVEEIKPLLHNEIQFHNGNCTIRFNDDDDDDYDAQSDIPIYQSNRPRKISGNNQTIKPIIRTTDMSPGEIVSSVFDKYDTKSSGCL